MKILITTASFLIILVLMSPRPAHAYLDPGSGSMIFQVVVAALAAVAISVKAFWHKIRGMFGAVKQDPTGNDDQQ